MEILRILPSRLNVIPDFLSEVVSLLKRNKIEEQKIFEIKLCLEEALVNSIKHGNKLDERLNVTTQVRINSDCIEIDLEDQGQGFDLGSLEDPTIEKNLCKLCGRGVFLIKEQMDKVEFFDGGRRLKMIKFLNKESSCGN
ncbi:MAG: ATP-binding protein [Candidatus Omnitrophica bacterium]|nr:ATP-binding protein [Candidatus Omnitrophota bacterium]